jgi:hypothetical protein
MICRVTDEDIKEGKPTPIPHRPLIITSLNSAECRTAFKQER